MSNGKEPHYNFDKLISHNLGIKPRTNHIMDIDYTPTLIWASYGCNISIVPTPKLCKCKMATDKMCAAKCIGEAVERDKRFSTDKPSKKYYPHRLAHFTDALDADWYKKLFAEKVNDFNSKWLDITKGLADFHQKIIENQMQVSFYDSKLMKDLIAYSDFKVANAEEFMKAYKQPDGWAILKAQWADYKRDFKKTFFN